MPEREWPAGNRLRCTGPEDGGRQVSQQVPDEAPPACKWCSAGHPPQASIRPRRVQTAAANCKPRQVPPMTSKRCIRQRPCPSRWLPAPGHLPSASARDCRREPPTSFKGKLLHFALHLEINGGLSIFIAHLMDEAQGWQLLLRQSRGCCAASPVSPNPRLWATQAEKRLCREQSDLHRALAALRSQRGLVSFCCPTPACHSGGRKNNRAGRGFPGRGASGQPWTRPRCRPQPAGFCVSAGEAGPWRWGHRVRQTWPGWLGTADMATVPRASFEAAPQVRAQLFNRCRLFFQLS